VGDATSRPHDGSSSSAALTYAEAGVSIEAGDEAVRRIAPLVRSTFRPEVLGDVGAFGALVRLPDGYDEPVLVSSTDGVGTKLAVAEATGRYDTIGIDLVAMCVDDIAVQGADPLFFLDYVSIGRVDPVLVEALVGGVAMGCRQAGCALVGGEIAEHGPGAPMDLAGFAVGVVERARVLDGRAVEVGDVLVGLPSPGLRSNGYSLARRVLLEHAGRRLGDEAWPGAERSLADELLRPSVVYAPALTAVRRAATVHAFAHITGGGLPGNLPRILPDGSGALVRTGSWPVPRIFSEIQLAGDIAPDELARVFNLGVGMVAVVPPDEVGRCQQALAAHGGSYVIGEVVRGEGVAFQPA
jgi:phosphoribosylformylglycinamidine cyclo-ligase